MKCQICGKPRQEDLFSYVTGEPVCCICKLNYIGGGPTTSQQIAKVRAVLGLKDGEYLQQDHAAEARRILGRGEKKGE